MINLLKLAVSKIAEPKTSRIIQFFIYAVLAFAGLFVLVEPPPALVHIVGPDLIYVFAIFIAVGSLVGLIAVLPGTWWLERVGIMFLATGLLMYLVMTIYSHASIVGSIVVVVIFMSKVQRWFEIKDWMLAPRKE